MIAAAMTYPAAGHDTLGVSGPNYQGHAVLHFDTEQSPYDWQQLVRSSLRRVGLAEPPPWLLSYTLAGLEAQKSEQFIHAALRAAQRRFKGIHSVFIDGVADLVNDPNDSQECFPLITRLHGAAIEHQTTFVTILHMNPSTKDKSDKGRGHLGSQLERKAESNLTLKKDGDITTVIGEGRQRGKPIPADKAPSFKWSDEHQMHRACGTPEGDKPASRAKRKFEIATFIEIVPPKSAQPKTVPQIYRMAQGMSSIKLGDFKDLLNSSAQDGTLERVVDPNFGILFRRAV